MILRINCIFFNLFIILFLLYALITISSSFVLILNVESFFFELPSAAFKLTIYGWIYIEERKILIYGDKNIYLRIKVRKIIFNFY